MPCLTLKSGAIVMVDSPEAFSEALGEKEHQELRHLLEIVRPELRLVKPVSSGGGEAVPAPMNFSID